MRQRDPQTAVLFVGTPDGMEPRELVAKAGYDYAAVEVSSFRRSHAGRRPSCHNLHAVGRWPLGACGQAILREFRPDLVVGTAATPAFPW